MNKFSLWLHNFFDLHKWEYSNKFKVPPCTRKCPKCKETQTMVGNNAGIWWMSDKDLVNNPNFVNEKA